MCGQNAYEIKHFENWCVHFFAAVVFPILYLCSFLSLSLAFDLSFHQFDCSNWTVYMWVWCLHFWATEIPLTFVVCMCVCGGITQNSLNFLSHARITTGCVRIVCVNTLMYIHLNCHIEILCKSITNKIFAQATMFTILNSGIHFSRCFMCAHSIYSQFFVCYLHTSAPPLSFSLTPAIFISFLLTHHHRRNGQHLRWWILCHRIDIIIISIKQTIAKYSHFDFNNNRLSFFLFGVFCFLWGPFAYRRTFYRSII